MKEESTKTGAQSKFGKRKAWVIAAIAAAVVAVLCALGVYVARTGPTVVYGIQSDGHYTSIGEIWTERPVSQEIPAPRNADGISLLFATYIRTNQGTVTVRVTGRESGVVYAESVFDAAEMADNSFVDIPFTVKPSGDTALEISVTSDSEPGSAVTLWKTEEDSVPGFAFFINGAEQSGDLVYRTYHETIMLFGWDVGALFRRDTGAQSGQDADADVNQDADTQSEQDTDEQSGQDADAEAYQDTEAEAEQDADAESEQDSDWQYEQDADWQYEQDAEWQYEQDAEWQYEQDAEWQYEQDADEQFWQDADET